MEQVLELLDILLRCDEKITEEQRLSMRSLYIAQFKLTQDQDPEVVKLKTAVVAGTFAELILKLKYNDNGVLLKNIIGLNEQS